MSSDFRLYTVTVNGSMSVLATSRENAERTAFMYFEKMIRNSDWIAEADLDVEATNDEGVEP